MPRESGKVLRWFDERGFGFIQPANRDIGTSVFVHISQTDNLALRPGDRVEFDIGTNPKTGKSEARNVSIGESP